MSQSRIDRLRETLREAFAGIRKQNGFNNDVAEIAFQPRDLEQITAFPSLSIIFGNETIEPKDERMSVFDSYLAVTVLGYVDVSADAEPLMTTPAAAEALLHDMKRVLAALLTEHMTDMPDRWMILPRRMPITAARHFDYSQGKAVVALHFQAVLLFQDAGF